MHRSSMGLGAGSMEIATLKAGKIVYDHCQAQQQTGMGLGVHILEVLSKTAVSIAPCIHVLVVALAVPSEFEAEQLVVEK